MLSKFCFFFSLNTGTIIIGVLNVLYGMHSVVEQIAAEEAHHRTREEEKFSILASSPNNMPDRSVEILYTENSLYTMQFLFGLYLIYGTVKEKQTFIFASMLLHLAFVAYASIFVAFAIITTLISQRKSLPNSEEIANEALKLPCFMYFVFIIYSRHEELAIKSPTLMVPLNRGNNDSDIEEINFF
uniref:Protein ycf2 n=1 Tax=Lygus hesperus TaxID=30085 RepID=A0A0A9W6G8_LYGHE